MTKVHLTTTLRLIREHHPCDYRYAALLASLGPTYDPDDPIDLLRILGALAPQDMAWALRATVEDCTRVRVALCADLAAFVEPFYDARFPGDGRIRSSIAACHRFARGKATVEELVGEVHITTHAARAAAYAAESDAASAAAYAAYAAVNACYCADDAAHALYAVSEVTYALCRGSHATTVKAMRACREDVAHIILRHLK